MFLRIKEHQSWHQESLCHPLCLSGTLNVLQVPPLLTPHSDTLLIEISTQNGQGMFLRVKEHHKWSFFTQRKIPWKFMLISQLEVCQEMGVKNGGTWRMLRVLDRSYGSHGNSWHHEWCFFTPRKTPWKLCVDISIRSVSRRRGSRRGVHGGYWGFLTRDMEDMVILDTMDDLRGPQGSYPEAFVSLSLFFAEM